jgi:hypothetical protein
MIHNGIEQGHLSILAETHYLMHHTAGIQNKEVADIFDSWNGTNVEGKQDNKAGEGEDGKQLYDNFLLKVGIALLVWTMVEFKADRL